MKKVIAIILSTSMVLNTFLPVVMVYALTLDYNSNVSSLLDRNVCKTGEYETVVIRNDGAIATLGCYATYSEAETVMNSHDSNYTATASIIDYNTQEYIYTIGTENMSSIASKYHMPVDVLKRDSRLVEDGSTLPDIDPSETLPVELKGKKLSVRINRNIVNAKYAMLDLRTKPSSGYNTNLSNSDMDNYINGYYGSDAPLIEYDYVTKKAKLKISGYTGWVEKNDNNYIGYNVVPISLVKTPKYYKVVNNELIHILTRQITDSNGYDWNWSMNLGPSPTFLGTGNYYSYDGNYFYTDLITLIKDYKANSYVNAINPTKPHYNYYQYLPYRTKTLYTSTDIDTYLMNKGYNAVPDSYPAEGNESMLYGQGPNFKNAEGNHGANALLTFALSINESGWGRSSIAITKNNIFGHGAFDYDPGGSATGYSDVKYSINYHSHKYVSYGYADPYDWRYNGAHFGNKASGMNISYASDPYWGEKMAGHYYNFDKDMGKLDYELYELGLKKTTSNINIRKEPTTNSDVLYKLEGYDIPVVILGEVTGEEIDGSSIWYKIQSDASLDSSRNLRADPNDPNGESYNWDNSYAYVHSSIIQIIGEEEHYNKKEGIFHFEKLEWDNTTQTVDFRGYLAVKGVDNKLSIPASYSLILHDVNTKKEYIIPLDRWTNTKEYPFEIPSEDGYDYSGAWFKSNIDLSNIPEGDYDTYVRARTNRAESKIKLKNFFSKPMVRKITDSSGRGYLFRTNYYVKDVPLELFIRDNGLVEPKEPPTIDNMFNSYSDISFDSKYLNIKGTSFNVNGDYSTKQDVNRKIILENTENFETFEFNSNYIDNGDYKVTLRVPDGKDKTRAWFNSKVDLSLLDAGRYAIIIKTTTGDVSDYGELHDIFSRALDQKVILGDRTARLELNPNKRMRVELVIEQSDIVNEVTNLTWNDNGINIEGWAYSKNAQPAKLSDISHSLVLKDINTLADQKLTLNSAETCNISVSNCETHNQFVGYKNSLDLRTIPNSTYLLNIETLVNGSDTYIERLTTNIDEKLKIVRSKTSGDEKLLTFRYEDNKIYLDVEDFNYEYDIAIDVGHCINCGSDGTENSTITERELNLIVSKYEKERFEAHGLTVWMNRLTDDSLPEMRLNNDWSVLHRAADNVGYKGVVSKIVYSNHHNGNTSTVSGFEIITPAKTEANKLTTELAIYDAWSKLDPTSSKPSLLKDGFYTRNLESPYAFYSKINGETYDMRNYYAMLRIPYEVYNVKNITYEPIYMTNPTEFNWYYNNNNWKKMSEIKIKHYVEALGKAYDNEINNL